ncbi:MAG TPA: hypothetical protein VN837_05595 [Chloroflexota bacterium]|nr:hypothetical protein [Chloroflexota bacterium]
MATIPHATLVEAARLHDQGMAWEAISRHLFWSAPALRKNALAAGLVHDRAREAARMRHADPPPPWAAIARAWGYADGQIACHAAYKWRQRHPIRSEGADAHGD